MCHQVNAGNIVDCSDKAPWAITTIPTCLCLLCALRPTYSYPNLSKCLTLQPSLGEITSYTKLICSRKHAQNRSWPITFSIKIIRKWKLAHAVGHKGLMTSRKWIDDVVYWINRVLFGLNCSKRLESGPSSRVDTEQTPSGCKISKINLLS